MKYTKCGREHDELTSKMLSMMETEPKDDKIEMAMGAIAKCLKMGLQEDKIDAAVDELNEVGTRDHPLWQLQQYHQLHTCSCHKCLHFRGWTNHSLMMP